MERYATEIRRGGMDLICTSLQDDDRYAFVPARAPFTFTFPGLV